jgi:hypothetical protein
MLHQLAQTGSFRDAPSNRFQIDFDKLLWIRGYLGVTDQVIILCMRNLAVIIKKITGSN